MRFFLKRLVAFVALLGVSYLLVVALAANAGDPLRGLFRRYTNIPVGTARLGDSSLARFREMQDQRDLDILFAGSSHCYRAFDSRIFARRGLRTFNMGSTSQTPVNSYYLLRDSLDQLSPKLLVYESFWGILDLDGLESFLDLSENLPLSRDLARMALATRNVRSINALLARSLSLRRPPLDEIRLELNPDDTYVPGGFVERRGRVGDFPRAQPGRVGIERRQLRYLRRLIERARSKGTRVLLVVQPVPADTLAAVENVDQYREAMRSLAAATDTLFIDFNELMSLDDEYFYDQHHLSQAGVELFNHRFLQELEARGLWREDRAEGQRTW